MIEIRNEGLHDYVSLFSEKNLRGILYKKCKIVEKC